MKITTKTTISLKQTAHAHFDCLYTPLVNLGYLLHILQKANRLNSGTKKTHKDTDNSLVSGT
jgi:hypothetical protein